MCLGYLHRNRGACLYFHMIKDFNTAKTEDTTNTWLTPPELLQELGEFDLDPCAATGRPWDCARVNYTREDDGLTKEWFGRIWCNPPYGSEAGPFLKKMSEYNGPGLCLIFVRSDTRVWHDYILSSAKYIFFLKGRLKFCRIDGKAAAPANAPSCLVAWSESELPVLQELERKGKGKIWKCC